MSYVEGIAMYLGANAVGTYDAVGAAGNIFLDFMPDAPDVAISVTGYGGFESPSNQAESYPTFQVRARALHSRDSRATCEKAYNLLHGRSVVLPDGTALELCVGIGADAASIGQDSKGRPEHVANFRAIVRTASAEAARE